MEEIKKEESWNKKRIFAALFLLVLLAIGGFFFKTRVLDVDSASKNAKSVKGVSLKEDKKNEEKKTDINIQGAVKEKLDDLKQQVSGLNILEIASSSVQIQKIIKDIKSLEQYPNNKVKEICKTICGL